MLITDESEGDYRRVYHTKCNFSVFVFFLQNSNLQKIFSYKKIKKKKFL